MKKAEKHPQIKKVLFINIRLTRDDEYLINCNIHKIHICTRKFILPYSVLNKCLIMNLHNLYNNENIKTNLGVITTIFTLVDIVATIIIGLFALIAPNLKVSILQKEPTMTVLVIIVLIMIILSARPLMRKTGMVILRFILTCCFTIFLLYTFYMLFSWYFAITEGTFSFRFLHFDKRASMETKLEYYHFTIQQMLEVIMSNNTSLYEFLQKAPSIINPPIYKLANMSFDSIPQFAENMIITETHKYNVMMENMLNLKVKSTSNFWYYTKIAFVVVTSVGCLYFAYNYINLGSTLKKSLINLESTQNEMVKLTAQSSKGAASLIATNTDIRSLSCTLEHLLKMITKLEERVVFLEHKDTLFTSLINSVIRPTSQIMFETLTDNKIKLKTLLLAKPQKGLQCKMTLDTRLNIENKQQGKNNRGLHSIKRHCCSLLLAGNSSYPVVLSRDVSVCVLKRTMMSSAGPVIARTSFFVLRALTSSEVMDKTTKNDHSALIKSITELSLDHTRGTPQHKSYLAHSIITQKFPVQEFYSHVPISNLKCSPAFTDFRVLKEVAVINSFYLKHKTDISHIQVNGDNIPGSFYAQKQVNQDFWVTVKPYDIIRPHDEKTGEGMFGHTTRGSIAILTYDSSLKNVPIMARDISLMQLEAYYKKQAENVLHSLRYDKVFNEHQYSLIQKNVDYILNRPCHTFSQYIWDTLHKDPTYPRSLSSIYPIQVTYCHNEEKDDRFIKFYSELTSRLDKSKTFYDTSKISDRKALYYHVIFAYKKTVDSDIILKLQHLQHDSKIIFEDHFLHTLNKILKEYSC